MVVAILKRRMLCWLGCGLLVWGGAVRASAGGTDPTLSIRAAQAQAGRTRVSLAVDASFLRGDVIQAGYPVQLLLWEEGASTYLRFALAGGVYRGEESGLADGLSAAEAMALLATGAPTSDARVLRMDVDRLELSVPASFPAGAARVQLFVVERGETFLSNGLSLTIPSFGAP